MDLPEEKGTYVLVTSVMQMRRIEIGRLGRFDIIPGYYSYVGSAFGSGGLRARLGHHLESTAEPHWHIDYLLQVAQLVEIWYTTADRKLEHHWADLLEMAPGFRIPIPRFGSSDYHRSRSSHLFYCKRRPAFEWFRQQPVEEFEDVHAERDVISQVGLEACGGQTLDKLSPAFRMKKCSRWQTSTMRYSLQATRILASWFCEKAVSLPG
jgi:Uri superfamily endonuclease